MKISFWGILKIKNVHANPFIIVHLAVSGIKFTIKSHFDTPGQEINRSNLGCFSRTYIPSWFHWTAGSERAYKTSVKMSPTTSRENRAPPWHHQEKKVPQQFLTNTDSHSLIFFPCLDYGVGLSHPINK